jgi:hypothetical protein
MVKLIKGDAVKILSPESSLIPLLKHEGWIVEGEKVEEAPRRGRPPKEEKVEE